MNWQAKMKMTKEEIRALKKKHLLELVMQEAGEVFEVNPANPDQWQSTITPGLFVDIRRQIYEIKLPGKDESGDLFEWLKRRYSWTFGMVINFLQKRPADPKTKEPIKSTKKTKVKINLNDEWKMVSHIYTDPITGSKSYGIKYNREAMDELQKKAFEIADEWILDYFSKPSYELFSEIIEFPHRFKRTVDFDIEECANCETPFNWSNAETSAYACEENEYLETDFVICEKCLRAKYAPRYRALNLAYRSACKRDEAWQEAERQRELEKAQMINEWEAARDGAAGGEHTEPL